MLAAASIGATFSSTSPDFGTEGVLDRFGQIEPVVLFATDGYRYNGKPVDCLGRLGEVAPRLPTVRDVVVVPFLDAAPDLSASRAPPVRRSASSTAPAASC
jgi:acetoacetyl-CoA synthetase